MYALPFISSDNLISFVTSLLLFVHKDKGSIAGCDRAFYFISTLREYIVQLIQIVILSSNSNYQSKQSNYQSKQSNFHTLSNASCR